MTKPELKSALETSLETFAKETTRTLDDYSKSPATEGDLKELSKQIYYVLNDFKNNLLEYLE